MLTAHDLRLSVIGAEAFEVRRFEVAEGMHELFTVALEVVSPNVDVDLDEVLGRDATFELQRHPGLPRRIWSGIVTQCHHVGVDDDQLSTYEIVVRPRLWLLTQRRNYRVFQQLSDPDIALRLLAEWKIEPRCAFDAAAYLGRKYRVQYAESDYAFLCRLLEDAGITYLFEEVDGETRVLLTDAPQAAPSREAQLPWVSAPVGGPDEEIVTQVQVSRHLRPGRYTQRDVDYRRSPELPLLATEGLDEGVEAQLERFHHNYGAFLYAAPASGDTPVADDRGAARTNLDLGQRQVARRLAAKRVDARRISFVTTAHDVAPGKVVSLLDHPRPELGTPLLVLRGRLDGTAVGEWHHSAEAAFAAHPWHPPLRTPKPRTFGLESATVVGPDDDEIHTDELARVRVQFHWDREGLRDTKSSCWIPVNQPWGGAGFGAVNIPRVGQEVIVDFLGEDPDRPVIVGRVFTKTNPAPYALPEHKTVSGLRSHSANQGLSGAAKQMAQQLAQQVIQAGAEAVGDAIGGAAGDAVSTALSQGANMAFGDRMPPLGSLLPEVAGMLAQLPKPGGEAFPTPHEGELPKPPLTDGSASRAVLSLPEFPNGPRGERIAQVAMQGMQVLARPAPSAAPTVHSAPPVAPTPPAIPTLPEVPLPEMPMDLERLQAALDNGFGAVSPNESTHLWSGSEVTMDDTLNSERLYVQAQRDMNVVVKGSANTIVGATRMAKIGTSDVLDVGQNQATRVGDHRGLDVRANQIHVVTGDIDQASVEGNQHSSSALARTTQCKSLVFVADEHIAVDCGTPAPPPPFAWNISGLLLMRDFVILDGPKLFLNPGEDALEQALATGEPPSNADQDRAAADQAAVDAARGALEEAWRNGDLQTYADRGAAYRQYELDAHPREALGQAWREFLQDHGHADPSRRYLEPFDQPPS